MKKKRKTKQTEISVGKDYAAEKEMLKTSESNIVIGTRRPTLDEIWGTTNRSKFLSNNKEDYRKKLAEMNKADLQSHLITLGLMPKDHRDTMITAALKEFDKDQNQKTASQIKPKILIQSPDVKRLFDRE